VPLIPLLSYVDTHLATGLCHSQGGPLNAQYSAEKKKVKQEQWTRKDYEKYETKTVKDNKNKDSKKESIGLYMECKVEKGTSY